MKANESERKSLKRTMLAGALVIGASTFVFQGFIGAATATELQKTNTVPTSYANHAFASSQAAKNSLSDGYQKANYTVRDIALEYFQNQTPTSADMPKEDAAEIGAQALWAVFGLNLEGQVIEMGYQPATENLPRANWYADVLIDGKRSYSFSVDSVTGELLTIGHDRKLDAEVSVAFDPVLDQNPQEYVDLAKKLAEKYHVVYSAVTSVEYNGQGYSNNDPTISLDIKGENGEIALMTFSRYDKALLGFSNNTEYKAALEASERFHNQVQEEAKELEKSAPSADENGAFLLKILE